MRKYILSILFTIGYLIFGYNTSFAGNSKTDVARNLNIFNNLFKELNTHYVDSIDADKMITFAIEAMLWKLDPYTTYFSSEEEFSELINEEYGGIGVRNIVRDSILYISYITEGNPAQLAGMKVGDQIIAINDEIISKSDINNVGEKIRGHAGTNVKITVRRPYANDSIITFDITRQHIKPNTVPYYGVINGNIGYIKLTSFKDDSFNKVKKALIELKQDSNVKSIILDLRDNPGGQLNTCIDILSLFLPKNTEILTTKGKENVIKDVYKTTLKPIDTKIPLVILINENSASASEVVAGSLQDLDRAVIIGSRSFGKGLVQSTFSCGHNSYLKVTTSKYYLPSGRLIQALDYSNRNPDGSITPTPHSLTNVYKTSRGREVRDGGGITPDIAIKKDTLKPITTNAINNYLIFDYATYFVNSHPSIDTPDKFEITDSIFNDFKQFALNQNFKYDKICEEQLNILKTSAEREGYMTDEVKAQFDILENMLHHDLGKDLDNNREEICKYLSSMIIQCYYFERGEIIHDIHNGIVIKEATKILSDPQKYNSILTLQNSK